MADSKYADMMTVLRHLVDNTQWQGNHGARAETQDAMDRLMGGQYGDDAAQADNDPNAKDPDVSGDAAQADNDPNAKDPNAKDPDVSGGSRNPAQAAKRNTGTGTK
jgi:hypothetical protein